MEAVEELRRYSLQQAIDMVAADLNSRTDRFKEVEAETFAERIFVSGLDAMVPMFCVGVRIRLEDNYGLPPFEEVQPYLPASFTEERYALLDNEMQDDPSSIQIDDAERAMLEEALACHSMSESKDFAIRQYTVLASDGTLLWFHAWVGEDGEEYDWVGPYEYRDQSFVIGSQYVIRSEFDLNPSSCLRSSDGRESPMSRMLAQPCHPPRNEAKAHFG